MQLWDFLDEFKIAPYEESDCPKLADCKDADCIFEYIIDMIRLSISVGERGFEHDDWQKLIEMIISVDCGSDMYKRGKRLIIESILWLAMNDFESSIEMYNQYRLNPCDESESWVKKKFESHKVVYTEPFEFSGEPAESNDSIGFIVTEVEENQNIDLDGENTDNENENPHVMKPGYRLCFINNHDVEMEYYDTICEILQDEELPLKIECLSPSLDYYIKPTDESFPLNFNTWAFFFTGRAIFQDPKPFGACCYDERRMHNS